MGFGGGFGMFFGPVLWIGLIVLVVYLGAGVMRRRRDGADDDGRRAPLEILDERLARGEIDQREYEDRRRTLEH